METISLGSIYTNGSLVASGSKYSGRFTIGNTADRKAIVWNKVGTKLIAAAPILVDISWDKLNENGFVYGKFVRIDGCIFQCRSMRLGVSEADAKTNSEWREVLEESGETSAKAWNWDNCFFWGQDMVYDDDRMRAVVGFSGPAAWSRTFSSQFKRIGFRPIIEEIKNIVEPSADILGKNVSLFDNRSKISGRLVEVSEYDLILKVESMRAMPTAGGAWMRLNADHIAVNRDWIVYTTVTS